MAKEIEVHQWCDNHSDGAKVPGHEFGPLMLGTGKPLVIDLCEACDAQLLEPLRQLLAEHGQPVDARDQLPPQPMASGGSNAVQVNCPGCGKRMLESTLAQHLFSVHLRMAKPMHMVCPECGWKPSRKYDAALIPRIVGNHRRREHNRSVLDDAVAAWEASQDSA